jgi:hypothetical protein
LAPAATSADARRNEIELKIADGRRDGTEKMRNSQMMAMFERKLKPWKRFW